MIRYICIAFILLMSSLSILSRINYSKYKDGRDPLWWVARWVACKVRKETKEKYSRYLRKVEVLNRKPLEIETDKKITEIIHSILVMVFILAAALTGISFIPEEKAGNVITRPGVAEDSSFVEMELKDKENGETEVVNLEIQPREYTETEFKEKCEETKKYIDSVILGENRDKDYITESLIFPEKNEDGSLHITWETDDPMIINNDGRLNKENIDENAEINIKASIRDNNFNDTYEIKVRVIKNDILTGSEKAKVEILNIEEENRSQDELEIPGRIGNVYINRRVEDINDKCLKLMMLGLLVIVTMAYYRIYKIKEKGEERDKELEDAYFGFVNRLTIYIGAGLTLKDALGEAVKKESCEYLVKEVRSCLNMISSGMSETRAYNELGKNIGIEEYVRLMSIISQNLTFGNSNLIKLMDDEVKSSFFLRKERIRKRGEEASEKLLIPTSILLLLVMLVVMYPAFINL